MVWAVEAMGAGTNATTATATATASIPSGTRNDDEGGHPVIRMPALVVGSETHSMQLTQPSTSVPSIAIWRRRM